MTALPPELLALFAPQGQPQQQQPAAPSWWTWGKMPPSRQGTPRAIGGPTQPAAAAGGALSGPVSGPGGARDDMVEARLSPGEHVLDTEFVDLAGDGSNDEGHRRIEGMKERLRRHKGGALARGKISPDAMPLEQYMRKEG